uniref:Gp37 protein n=1 Tax=Candidatus Kentrum sp. LFY TaxID=2126342 RepID=A0A450UE45_9GAMM|nr:MAG: hypothetical protein BECKLFY1418A_GA0070994_101330 [Candidatus Kentron sp. LFY]
MESLTPLIEHLKQKPTDFHGRWFRRVAGAGDFASARQDALPLPVCWVIRGADKVNHAGERAEDVTVVLDVVIAIENERTRKTGETDDLLLAYRKAVRALLLGWEMTTDVEPMRFAGGMVMEYTARDFFWRDRYEFDVLITNYLPDPPGYHSTVYSGGDL